MTMIKIRYCFVVFLQMTTIAGNECNFEQFLTKKRLFTGSQGWICIESTQLATRPCLYLVIRSGI